MWQIGGETLSDLDQQFVLEHDTDKVDMKYFRELIKEIPAQVEDLDKQIEPFLDRPFHELDAVECAIMRLGVYELKSRPDIPYKVVINEAIELSKMFGAEESHKYINGILDRVAKNLRAVEVNAAKLTTRRSLR
jgi:N utilization substance protein B